MVWDAMGHDGTESDGIMVVECVVIKRTQPVMGTSRCGIELDERHNPWEEQMDSPIANLVQQGTSLKPDITIQHDDRLDDPELAIHRTMQVWCDQSMMVVCCFFFVLISYFF